MIWYKIENKKPIATESGCWDGLKSSKILVATKSRTVHIVEMYEGVIDSNKFCDFYDEHDFQINNVILWAELDCPF